MNFQDFTAFYYYDLYLAYTLLLIMFSQFTFDEGEVSVTVQKAVTAHKQGKLVNLEMFG